MSDKKPLNPATFDVEAWLTDAALPEESATVYKRADVIGELTDLKRRIEIERDANIERVVTQKSAAAALEEQYEALLKTFTGSALTVYVRALSRDEIKHIRQTHDAWAEANQIPPLDANVAFGYDLLSASIVAMKPAGATERQPTVLDPTAVKRLEAAIGSTQLQLILQARQTAQNAVPAVDADFLRRPSGTGTGHE